MDIQFKGSNMFIGSYKIMDFVLKDMDLNELRAKQEQFVKEKLTEKDLLWFPARRTTGYEY